MFECLLVLVLLASVSAVGIQSWCHTFAQREVSVVQAALLQTVRFARLSAVMQSKVITVCGSGDGRRCDGRWSDGFLVVDSQHHVLRFRPQLIRLVHIVWRGGFGVRDYLKFAPSGYTLGQQGRFYLCARPPLQQQSQAVVVSAGGRARVEVLSPSSKHCLSVARSA